jgi:uncharacterized membrane protein
LVFSLVRGWVNTQQFNPQLIDRFRMALRTVLGQTYAQKKGNRRRSRRFALRDHMAKASAHVEGTVQALAQLRDEHERKATPLQRLMGRFTRRAASPVFVILLTAIFIFWIGVNSALLFVGKKPVDEPPFFWMQGAVSLAALYMTVLILSTQRRENELTSHHEHLTLELAILSEQKTTKIIALLEELRQDHPDIHDRIDNEAASLSEPTDTQSVLETIKRFGAN